MKNKKKDKQVVFEGDRIDYTDREIQLEILYTNWLIRNATERTRSNTSTIVWIIIISIILIILSVLFNDTF
jgi:hypothetical protein